MMNLWQRLKLRWALRGSTNAPMTSAGLPTTEQTAQETADAKWKQAHGFSAATAPLPWGEDISAHNKAVDLEYAEEIEKRKAAMLAGEYHPRFLNISNSAMSDERLEEIVERGEKPTPDEIDWTLEMTLGKGRRVDVTEGIGVPVQNLPTPVQHFEARMAGNMAREVAAIEQGLKAPSFKTPRHLIGSRASIVEACRGDEGMADQVEASARLMFGVEDLDAPLPEMKDA